MDESISSSNDDEQDGVGSDTQSDTAETSGEAETTESVDLPETLVPALSTWKKFRNSRAFLITAVSIPVLIGISIYLPWELQRIALPDLVGLTLAEAETELKSLDMDVEIEVIDGPKSQLDKFWEVDQQTPTAGARVSPGAEIALQGGLVMVSVPTLDALSNVADAEKLLATRGLNGKVEFGYIDGATVDGSEDIAVEDLNLFLEEFGIHGEGTFAGTVFPVTVDSEFLSSEMANVVIPSNAAGTRVKAGSTVALILVPPVTIVPNAVGGSVADARTKFADAYVIGDFGESEDWFTIKTQTPKPGSLFMIGSRAVETTAAPDKAAFKALSQSTWSQIIKDPDSYSGTRAVLYGEVVQFDVNTGSCAFRMQTGPAQTERSYEYDQNTYVVAGAQNCDLLKPIVQDDHLRIRATISGARTYSTSIGGSATALEIEIWSFDSLAKQKY
ncbi:PASTA domain-containing protein [Salinibacterium sp. SWN139]|uniref:PASTA domain-containing protein n=1 Tax=Salinibacterium sp. SWN139 TaxID=2792055 RepID=UPI0018CF9CB1|nr:PASTA domain-containing protein [Salinibacterium sp. SWN139]MBH0054411.1 PASTA domain-containing protein [Salinibacterium sp. SWN139]